MFLDCKSQLEHHIRSKAGVKKGRDETKQSSVGFFKGLFNKKRDLDKDMTPNNSTRLPSVNINEKVSKVPNKPKPDDIRETNCDTKIKPTLDENGDKMIENKMPETKGSTKLHGPANCQKDETRKTQTDIDNINDGMDHNREKISEESNFTSHRKKKKKKRRHREEIESPVTSVNSTSTVVKFSVY